MQFTGSEQKDVKNYGMDERTSSITVEHRFFLSLVFLHLFVNGTPHSILEEDEVES